MSYTRKIDRDLGKVLKEYDAHHATKLIYDYVEYVFKKGKEEGYEQALTLHNIKIQ